MDLRTIIVERLPRRGLWWLGLLLALALASGWVDTVTHFGLAGLLVSGLFCGFLALFAVVVWRRSRGLDHDASQREQAEDKLQFANTLLTTTMEASPDAILVVDQNARIISFNRRFCTLWKIPEAALTSGEDGPVLAAVTASVKNPEAFVARVRYLYAHPEEVVQEEIETRDDRIIERHTAVMHRADGRYLGRVWFFRDITDRKRAEAEIRRTARQDLLTDLANRSVFMEAVARASAAAASGEPGFAVLYLDLDHFKDVNDTLGHPAGDALLREVANRLRISVRNTDLVARFGGDEFAVMAAAIREPDDAVSLAGKLVAALSRPLSIAGNDIRCGASIGIAVSQTGVTDPELLLSQADVALYQAKSDGRAGYRVFTASMETDVRNRVAITAELRSAISEGQLFLRYQPLIDATTGGIAGVEALVRWNHPERGVLAADSFIGVAETTGLVVPLDRWVRREACCQARAWLDAGLPPVVMAVNVSGAQFKRPLELERDVADVLHNTGLPASNLELQLTETVLMAASVEHNDVLVRLRAGGVGLSIDDFGAGYSSLDYLRRFPVDRIKIARAFVRQVADDKGSAAIVRATVALARELGVVAVAEGVERAEQFELLKSWGCPQMQGNYFSRPLAPEEFALLLGRSGIAETAAQALPVSQPSHATMTAA